ncbi:MAG: prolyl oligopeptidase family serine peptidase [Eubacteriales bacterium]|nr:prolyl oligopeptidase family serine peptidase [Eubacteriales bacterium]
MSIPKFCYMDTPQSEYLALEIDMRGRAFSEGSPDCNGYELIDVIDAIEYAKIYYKDLILDSDVIFFESGSGGGGNALAIAGKFPDYFAAINALYPISDYAEWYAGDEKGEFRNELDVWIGYPPGRNPEGYRSRSGVSLLSNLRSPIFIAHGANDLRVPVQMSRRYKMQAEKLDKGHLVDYYEMAGVGNEDHLGNITEAQKRELEIKKNRNLTCRRMPVEIPDKGEMVIGGYLVTKKFKIFLYGLDEFARLEYDLSKNFFRITSKKRGSYSLEYKGLHRSGLF